MGFGFFWGNLMVGLVFKRIGDGFIGIWPFGIGFFRGEKGYGCVVGLDIGGIDGELRIGLIGYSGIDEDFDFCVGE